MLTEIMFVACNEHTQCTQTDTEIQAEELYMPRAKTKTQEKCTYVWT